MRFLVILLLALEAGVALRASGPAVVSRPRAVAVTFDDLPGVSVARPEPCAGQTTALAAMTAKLLATLTAERVPVVGFVNEGKLGPAGAPAPERVALLRAWRDAKFELVAMMRRRGYAFVTLERALEDPAYASADTFTGRGGVTWLHRWALSTGARVLPDEPKTPPFVLAAASVTE